MNMRTRLTTLLGAAVLACLAAAPAVDAQTYPTQSPTYTPAAQLAPVTLTAAGDVVFRANGLGAVNVTLTGTYSVLTAAVQGAVSTATSPAPTWVTLGAIPLGSPSTGKPVTSLTANGSYRINATGWAQLRVHVTAFTGTSVTASLTGTSVSFFYIPSNSDLGALITNTAQAAATVNSPDQSGGDVTSVICVFNQTANTAGSTVISIQNKDVASGLYYTLVSSAAVTTANNTPSAIAAGRGVQASANVSSSLPIATTWRVQEVAGGTSTTGTVGCTAH